MKQKNFKNLYYQNVMRTTIDKKFIINFFNLIRRFFGGDRFSNLIPYIHEEIYLIKKKINRRIKLLDYGCGNMAFTTFLIQQRLIREAICVDNYNLDNKKLINKHCKYINLFQSKSFLKKKFDVTIIIDVLHHISVDKIDNILKKLCNISRYVIIKDHYEYGYFSRQILRLADWFGNYGTTINIPKTYFTKQKWEETLKKLKLKQIKIIENVNQHNGLFSLLLPSKHQFISLLINKI